MNSGAHCLGHEGTAQRSQNHIRTWLPQSRAAKTGRGPEFVSRCPFCQYAPQINFEQSFTSKYYPIPTISQESFAWDLHNVWGRQTLPPGLLHSPTLQNPVSAPRRGRTSKGNGQVQNLRPQRGKNMKAETPPQKLNPLSLLRHQLLRKLFEVASDWRWHVSCAGHCPKQLASGAKGPAHDLSNSVDVHLFQIKVSGLGRAQGAFMSSSHSKVQGQGDARRRYIYAYMHH